MDPTGLSGERGSRSVSGHGSSGVRDRRGRRPRSSTVRPGPVNVRVAGAVESPAAARGPADQRQAEYFLCLLAQSRRHVDHRIGECEKAIATAEVAGDLEGARNFRRMASSEEQDRKTLDGMIENLHRRFGQSAAGQVSKPLAPTRSLVR